MPQIKKVRPKTLQKLCLIYSATLILDGCTQYPEGESKAIQDLASSIPVTLANEYMSYVHFITDHGKQQYEEVNIRDAMCPWCTRVSLTPVSEEDKLLVNLDRLENLTHLWLGRFHIYGDNPKIAYLVAQHLPGLRKLKSLRMATVVTDEAELFKKLVEYCRDLEELSIRWGLSRNQQVTLANCSNLKRVFVEYFGEEVNDVSSILDSIPQLEVLHIPRRLVSPLLQSLRKSYPLKKLTIYECNEPSNYSATQASTLLRCLAQHFPRLAELDGEIVQGCQDLTPLNRFEEMRILGLSCCIPEQMSGVDGAVFARLVRLSLSSFLGLSSSLKTIKDISMPNLLDLTLFNVEEVDLQQLEVLCPQLHELVLCDCGVTPINPEETLQPFTKLQKLFIFDFCDSYNWDHFMMLMSECRDLEVLNIWQYSLDNSTMHKLLECNPMTRMHRFRFRSNRLTPDIATVVFKYFGDDLVNASFKGSMMQYVPRNFLQDLRQRMQPYRLSLTVGSFTMETGQASSESEHDL